MYDRGICTVEIHPARKSISQEHVKISQRMKTRLERNNETWLRDLKGPGRDAALEDLRLILLRGLGVALSEKISSDPAPILDDFVQEALMKILEHLDDFRGESQFTTWAQKIAIRVAYSELRRRRWRDVSLESLIPDSEAIDFTPALLSDPAPSPERQAMRHWMLERVRQAILEELTDRQRRALLAILAGGMPIEEVAQRMGTNRNALYKLLFDARKRLKQRLQTEGLSPADILTEFINE
jgi:RNA polymerase sigma-70 factor (ECF subfamily)